MSVPKGGAHEEPEDEAWLMTYADMITLLMAFFVIMASVSKVDQSAYDEVSAALNENRTKERNKEKERSQTLQRDIKDVVSNEGADQVVTMGVDAQGNITLTFDGGAFFKPGSADLQEQAIPVLRGITEELSQPIYTPFNISVEGHTDDGAINTPRFPSNWELSSGRAATVVRFMLDHKKESDQAFEPKRFRAMGYADTQPLRANRDIQGNVIPENQAANRRVVMRIGRKAIYENVRVPTFRRSTAEQVSEAVKGAAKKGDAAKKGAEKH
jgi:chemotaxis protein MotB